MWLSLLGGGEVGRTRGRGVGKIDAGKKGFNIKLKFSENNMDNNI